MLSAHPHSLAVTVNPGRTADRARTRHIASASLDDGEVLVQGSAGADVEEGLDVDLDEDVAVNVDVWLAASSRSGSGF